MANVDAAFGFVPIRHMSGNAPRTNKYTIATGLAETSSKVTYALLQQTVLLLRTQLRKLITLACLMVARIPLQTDLISIANIGQLAQPLQTLSRIYTMIHTPYSVCNPQVLLLRPTLATALTL
jgi:hypothetical protein